MNNEVIHAMTDNFEGHAQKTDSGIEFWMRVMCSICLVMENGRT